MAFKDAFGVLLHEYAYWKAYCILNNSGDCKDFFVWLINRWFYQQRNCWLFTDLNPLFLNPFPHNSPFSTIIPSVPQEGKRCWCCGWLGGNTWRYCSISVASHCEWVHWPVSQIFFVTAKFSFTVLYCSIYVECYST